MLYKIFLPDSASYKQKPKTESINSTLKGVQGNHIVKNQDE